MSRPTSIYAVSVQSIVRFCLRFYYTYLYTFMNAGTLDLLLTF